MAYESREIRRHGVSNHRYITVWSTVNVKVPHNNVFYKLNSVVTGVLSPQIASNAEKCFRVSFRAQNILRDTTATMSVKQPIMKDMRIFIYHIHS